MKGQEVLGIDPQVTPLPVEQISDQVFVKAPAQQMSSRRGRRPGVVPRTRLEETLQARQRSRPILVAAERLDGPPGGAFIDAAGEQFLTNPRNAKPPTLAATPRPGLGESLIVEQGELAQSLNDRCSRGFGELPAQAGSKFGSAPGTAREQLPCPGHGLLAGP